MKITKSQLRRIIREAYNELPENMDDQGRTIPQHEQLYTMLADIAIHFLLNNENETTIEIYDELIRRLEARGLSTDVDHILEEL